jgi:hypothetical protein
MSNDANPMIMLDEDERVSGKVALKGRENLQYTVYANTSSSSTSLHFQYLSPLLSFSDPTTLRKLNPSRVVGDLSKMSPRVSSVTSVDFAAAKGRVTNDHPTLG